MFKQRVAVRCKAILSVLALRGHLASAVREETIVSELFEAIIGDVTIADAASKTWLKLFVVTHETSHQ